MKYKDVHQYISCAEVWIEYPLKYFGVKEVCWHLCNGFGWSYHFRSILCCEMSLSMWSLSVHTKTTIPSCNLYWPRCSPMRLLPILSLLLLVNFSFRGLIYQCCSDFLALEKLLPFFDLFHKEPFKSEVCKMILQSFIRVQHEPSDNAVAMSALLYISRVSPLIMASLGVVINLKALRNW
jgi:hypothetical protein